ncbi:fatty acyl-CoA synthetase [Paeniglutamicibacter psychrophenolicus]|uniref:Fatty-acyl-CoA synthase n=1 Tax=Paeniglutamicibacter psychrophenolicus TaxID=257454 RepID=A0ABS4WDR7_9MICC|nr:fatty acyl-CoA synthetase [Paeniglutamicibacter psychrophenolicus]MBP2374347.1 fatty-acyl-CoA synthase [Paeniglutamicibacter psychrophenolicus]
MKDSTPGGGQATTIAATDPSDTIAALLRRSASRNPNTTALEFQDRRWTYRELDAAVHRVAGRLRRVDLPAGSRVAAYGANSDAYAILFLACAAAGLVHVPVNFALKGDELTYLLEDSGAVVVVADGERLPLVNQVRADGRAGAIEQVWSLLPGASETASILDTALDPEAGEDPVDVGVGGGDLAQLLYTSGTTSAPKGAMMTHSALVAQYVSSIIALDFTAEDRPLIAMPLYHSAAMHVFLLPYLSLGATVRLLAKPDIAEILERVEAEHIGSLFLAPTVWVPLGNHPDLDTRDLSSLTKAQYGASIMPVTVLHRLRSRYPGIGFYNCFGQSELGPLCSVLRPDEHEARPASCGRPVFFVEARVVNAEGMIAKDGEPGEVQYRSPQVMSGYWNKPEETAAAFTDGWFRSGDQVTRDHQGYIQVVDRIKDVINTGGVLVAPREVEDCIYELDEVAEVAVIGLEDERWIEAITAVVVLKDGAVLTAESVRRHVKGRIANHKVPKRVDFVSELPRNQSGKLLKRQLRAERS